MERDLRRGISDSVWEVPARPLSAQPRVRGFVQKLLDFRGGREEEEGVTG